MLTLIYAFIGAMILFAIIFIVNIKIFEWEEKRFLKKYNVKIIHKEKKEVELDKELNGTRETIGALLQSNRKDSKNDHN
jgi:hypothetical protein